MSISPKTTKIKEVIRGHLRRFENKTTEEIWNELINEKEKNTG